MAVYLDSSAVVKLVVVEPESTALRGFLRRRSGVVASSALARLEVVRAVHRHGAAAVARAQAQLRRIRLVRIDDALLDSAATLASPVLRSLDAIHVALALALGRDLFELVTYDAHMEAAARAAGITVRAPGA